MRTTIPVAAYLEFLAKEYLAEFVGRGGASVKFCVGDETARAALHQGLCAAAADDGYAYVGVDAATTRLHLVEQLFFAVTRTIDFDEIAAAVATSAYRAAGFPTAGSV